MNQLSASRIALSGLLVSSCVLVTALSIREARACSYAAPPPALQGYPEPDAAAVPTDVRPIYESRLFYAAVQQPDPAIVADDTLPRPSPFELVDEAGVITPLLLGNGGAWYMELVPSAELAPRTRYVVRTVAEKVIGERLQLSFTTGDGPVSAPPAPPSAELEHYTLTSATPSSCSPLPTGTCLRFPEPSPGVYVQVDHFQQGTPFRDDAHYLSREPWFSDIAGIHQGHPFDCMELRARAPNGVLSEPVTRCRGDGLLYDIRGSEAIACTVAGITQDGRLLSARVDDGPPVEEDDVSGADAPTGTPPAAAAAGPAAPAPIDVTSAAPDVASAQRSSCGLVTPGRSSVSLLWAAVALLALPLRRKRQ